MLEMGKDDFVARLKRTAAIARRHQIDRLGGALGEDDFLFRSGIYKALNLDPRILIGLR